MTARYEAEIKLAERGYHVLMERIALKRMPADALPAGDVYDLLNTVGERLEIDALQEKGEKVPKRRIKKATRNLIAAIDRLTEWPEEPRLRVATELVATLRAVELDTVAENLLVALQQADAHAEDAARGIEEEPAEETAEETAPEEPAEETPAVDVPARIREIIENGEWTPELEDHLRTLRDLSSEEPDDDLLNLLNGGVVFNAVAGRKHLLLEERRRLAEAEPLPEEYAEALARIPDNVVGSELSSLGLHLVLADVIAAGLVPERSSPEMTIAATLVAMQRLDEPGKKPDIDALGSWAKTMPLKLDVQSDEVAKVFRWEPPELEGSIERRHEQRWKVQSLMYQFLPVRWMPQPHEERPPYSAAKARERLEDLGDVAWLMVDEIEPVRFVSEAFRFGDGAPDAVDLEIVRDVIALWKEQSLVSAVEDFGRAYLEDEWKHEIPEDSADEPSEFPPSPKTADGEPLVLCTVAFDVAHDAHDQIVDLLDVAEGFRRERGAGANCWAWLGPSKSSDKVRADLVLAEDMFTVQTQSLAWASKANSRLVEELGDRIVLKDIRTQEATPEMLAELGIEAGEEEAEAVSEDQKQVVHQVLENHYRKWLYEPLPALDDASPRDAVTDPVTRVEVVKRGRGEDPCFLLADERVRLRFPLAGARPLSRRSELIAEKPKGGIDAALARNISKFRRIDRPSVPVPDDGLRSG
jgi:hypothetical protein